MRKIFTLFLIGVVSIGFAQSPFFINYQGVARDASNNPLAAQTISLKFEILQGSQTGSVIYTDTQQGGATTNALGLFTTLIGKNSPLSAVNWQGGPYYLQVSMDATGGTNYQPLGNPQQVVSVPFSMHAASVPSSYANDILTIGTKTHAISSGTPVTVSAGTSTNITVSAGPNYTISYVPPTLNLSGGNALSIVGSNTVFLPSFATPTLVPSGIATVTNGASSYTVGVPAPSYNSTTGVLTVGSSNTNVVPNLNLAGSILYLGPFSNSVNIPGAVTVSGTGLATVTGGPSNYLVNVPPPTLALSSNNLSISIVGSNSVALPAAVTVAQAANNIITVSGGPQNYVVGMAAPAYNGTVLTLGAVSTTIAPTLGFNNGTLTVGPNTVDISGTGPFKQAGTTVTLTTVSNSVALGLSTASAKLDVYSNVAAGSVLRASNANASNASPAVDISSLNGTGLSVVNSSAGGTAADFNATGGYAINATSGSSSIPTLYANNTNVSGEAGYFNGAVRVSGKSTTSANFAMKVTDSGSANLLVVRNDGNVGVGVNNPTKKLEVGGTVKITDGTEGDGKVLTSDAAGNASWQAPTLTTVTSFTQQFMSSANTTPANFPAPLATFTKVRNDSKVQVIIQTHVNVGQLFASTGVIFEVKLGGTAASGNSGKVAYFIDNAGSTPPSTNKSVTIIAEFTGVLAAGSYNIDIAAYTGSGTASTVSLDSGNWGTNSIIIKEYR